MPVTTFVAQAFAILHGSTTLLYLTILAIVDRLKKPYARADHEALRQGKYTSSSSLEMQVRVAFCPPSYMHPSSKAQMTGHILTEEQLIMTCGILRLQSINTALSRRMAFNSTT